MIDLLHSWGFGIFLVAVAAISSAPHIISALKGVCQ